MTIEHQPWEMPFQNIRLSYRPTSAAKSPAATNHCPQAMLPRLPRVASQLPNPVRFFSQTPIAPSKPLPPRIKINDADISISYLKGTGPGGQKIVRDSTTVPIALPV